MILDSFFYIIKPSVMYKIGEVPNLRSTENVAIAKT